MSKQLASRGHEIKSFAFKMDGVPDEEGRFTGYAAVFGNVDRGNDVIDPGATTKTLQENPEVPLFWQHNYNDVPIGVGTLSADPSGKGVRIEGKLFIETSEAAREVFGAMKARAVKGLSIGYNTVKRAFEGKVRRLQEIAIGEVSLCNAPMNPLALVDGVKDVKDSNLTTIVALLAQYLQSEASDPSDDAAYEPAPYHADPDELVVCPSCDKHNDDDASYCDQCGFDLTSTGFRPRAYSADPDETVTCPACGLQDDTDASFCDQCGFELVGAMGVEQMSGPIKDVMHKLQALVESEPASATRQLKRAANEDATEPDLSTLHARLAALRAA